MMCLVYEAKVFHLFCTLFYRFSHCQDRALERDRPQQRIKKVKKGCLQPAKGGSGRGELKAPKKTKKDIELSYCIEIYNVQVWNMVKLTLYLNMQACQQHSDLKPPGSNPILSALDKSLSSGRLIILFEIGGCK